jgi:hypothetical protein
MALRALGKQLMGPLATTWVRCSSSSPTVFDKMVQIFVIDKSGVRHTVRGMEGTNLATTLQVRYCCCCAAVAICPAPAVSTAFEQVWQIKAGVHINLVRIKQQLMRLD